MDDLLERFRTENARLESELAEARKKPEPGEFTKDMRVRLTGYLDEACDIIDHLTMYCNYKDKSIKRLREKQKNQAKAINFLVAKIERLTDEKEHFKQLAGEALGGPVKEFELLLACERLAQQDKSRLTAENEAKDDVLRKIKDWCRAYPLEVFPEPDLKKAAKVLKEAGMTLDSISASNMRHVLKGIQKIIEGGD